MVLSATAKRSAPPVPNEKETIAILIDTTKEPDTTLSYSVTKDFYNEQKQLDFSLIWEDEVPLKKDRAGRKRNIKR